MRILLFALGAWAGVFLAISTWLYLHMRSIRRKWETVALAGLAPDAPAGDPLDSLDPDERELFLQAWWTDVLAMPEVELEEAEVAYLDWVKQLPEQVS